MRLATLRAWLSFAVVALALGGCGGDDGDLADIYTYQADSPYSGVIEPCVRAEDDGDHCTLGTLPVLGMETGAPGIPAIMDRVAVSHDWMGARFRELLAQMPADMLPLFKSVTAVVIDADIRPAYYTAATGAIYLDPALLWLSVAEKKTINPKQDFRAGFDDPLAFRHLNRYVKDGAAAYRMGSLLDDSARELDDVVLLAARLLLHVLAHANDFIPPDSYHVLNTGQTLSEAANTLSEQWVSSRLVDVAPLTSETMFSLAGVMYSGHDPAIEDLEISAGEVGAAFEIDGAGDDYGHTTQYEDLAMLFETVMMKYFFDADYEMAFTGVPEHPALCDSYRIGWGVRNRVGDAKVKSRAEFVARQLLPDVAFDDFFTTLDPATEISGDWCIESGESERQKPQRRKVDAIDLRRPYL